MFPSIPPSNIISLESILGWYICQIDVKTTFIDGPFEEVYINHPRGFDLIGHETYLQGKKKYGLK